MSWYYLAVHKYKGAVFQHLINMAKLENMALPLSARTGTFYHQRMKPQETMMMHALSVLTFDRFLAALSGILTKAEAHCEAAKIAPDALLLFRLYPDMFTFTRQVQLACDFAARASARLAGETPRSFADTESTFPELQARIRAARDYITGLDPARFEGAAERTITFPAGGRDMQMSGADYLSLYATPQVHFHLTTAYNILRHNGLAIGKRDYMGAA